jgi:hypothetical protein
MSRGGYGRQAQEFDSQEFGSDVRLKAKRLVLGRIGGLRRRVPHDRFATAMPDRSGSPFGSSSEQIEDRAEQHWMTCGRRLETVAMQIATTTQNETLGDTYDRHPKNPERLVKTSSVKS